MHRAFRAFSVVAALAAAALSSSASAQELPAARDLVARYVAAIGGRDAVLNRTTIRTVGSFEMPAQGIRGDLRLVQSKDGRTRMTISIPGMGELTGGYDGSVGWSMNPMQGPRLLEGQELAQTREDAGLLPLLRESPEVAGMETVEKAEIGGEACYKVKITYKSGRTLFDCYSIATGLLAGSMATAETAMGTMQVVTVISDWKEFGGLRMATRMTQDAMGQQQVISISEVVFDDAADRDAFALPDPVKALVAPAP